MKMHRKHRTGTCLSIPGRVAGFSLVELMVAMVITALIAGLLLVILQSTSDLWRQNTGRSQTFSSARAAFETISRTLASATLNTYLDYFDSSRLIRQSGDLNFRPDVYGRNSDLHFVTGNNLVNGQQGGAMFFTAPMDFEEGNAARSTGGQLNGVGFFVRFGPDPTLPAFIDQNPSRYRLYQFFQPTGQLKVMNPGFSGNQWFTSDTNPPPGRFCYPLANNIVAFAVLPKLSSLEDEDLDSLSTDYSYDSRMGWGGGPQPSGMHQLPPVVRVVMVALDETSANRIENGTTAPDLGFDPATVFDDPAELEGSLKDITDALSERGMNYRVFSTEIPIRTAKWSQ
jgi:uncharacterized protein (TIGR02599 family)